MKISKLKKDESREKSGVWVDLVWDEGESCKLKLRPWQNKQWMAEYTKLLQRTGMNKKARTVGSPQEFEARLIATAKHVLVDWEDIQDDEGNQIPYSVQSAVELLKIDEFFTFVQNQSLDHELFAFDDREEVEGNSSSTSGGA